MPIGNTFDNTNNYKLIIITNANICAGITTNKIVVTKFQSSVKNSTQELEFMGTFPIKQINDNGTVHFEKGIVNNATNICRIKKFFD